jgi:hypothetical protein
VANGTESVVRKQKEEGVKKLLLYPDDRLRDNVGHDNQQQSQRRDNSCDQSSRDVQKRRKRRHPVE